MADASDRLSESKEYSEKEKEELLEGMNHVLSELLDRSLWNSGQTISELRKLLSLSDPSRTSLLRHEIRHLIDRSRKNTEEMKERLQELADSPSQWDELVVRLPLETKFPNAKP